MRKVVVYDYWKYTFSILHDTDTRVCRSQIYTNNYAENKSATVDVISTKVSLPGPMTLESLRGT